jgi:DNA-binding transcriptional ArsR family regulator
MAAMDAVFKALADASRRSLLDRLHAENGQSLNELCDGLAMTRQAVTKHLAILEAANLVSTLKHGREEAALPQPGADPSDRRAVDQEIRARQAQRARRIETSTGEA